MTLLIIPLLAAAAPYIVPAIAAAVGYFGTKAAQKRQDKQQEDMQQYNTEMYQRQRNDAMSDWQMQNQYNSPSQQMQRLREAGLNPHLIYGKGAENTAAMIRASSSSNPTPPSMGQAPISEAFSSAQSSLQLMSGLRMQRAQTDNLYAQRALMDAQTAGQLQKTARDKFDLEQADRAKDIAFEQLLQNYLNSQKQGENLEADTNLKKLTAERMQALTPLEVEKTTQEISNLQVTRQLTASQVDKIVADTQAVIDGNKRANELQQPTKDLLLLQVNEQLQRMGLAPITMPELQQKLDQMSTETALKKFELEFQNEFRKLGETAKTAYMAAMILKLLTEVK